MSLPNNQRPEIALSEANGLVTHNGQPCRVVLGNHVIRVGCTDITLIAAKHIMKQWESRFGNPCQEFVLQTGGATTATYIKSNEPL